MITWVQLTMNVRVFDPDLLIKVANEHSIATSGADMGDLRNDLGSCVQMLLDPGGGGASYTGSLNDAGIQIEESYI